MQTKLPLLFLALAATGCASVGVQYPTEQAGPDAAEVIDGRGVYINSVNDKGCYSGRTAMSRNFKLLPGKEVVLAAESAGGALGQSNFCRALIAFTPQPRARYALRSEIVSTSFKGFFGGQTTVRGCKLNLVQVDAVGTEKPVATETRVLRNGFACIRFVNPQVKEDDEQQEEEEEKES